MLSVKYVNTKLRARDHHKFQRPYAGPFRILEKLHETSFRLALPPSMKIHNVFYGGLLKPYTGSEKAFCEAKPVAEDSPDEMYLVESIIQSRPVRGETHYLVKWVGYAEESNTWEPRSSLIKYVPEFIEEFERRSQESKAKRRLRLAARNRRK